MQRDRTVGRHRGRGQRQAALRDIQPHKRDVAARRTDQAAVGCRATARVADLELETTQIGRVTRPHHDAFAGYQRDLAVVGLDIAEVARILTEQKDVTATLCHDLRAGLDGNVTDESARRGGKHRRLARRPGCICQHPLEDRVGDVERRRHQRSHIDLRGATEHDAILVDDVDLSFGLDRAENHARRCRTEHTVERHPIVAAVHRISRALIEVKRGVAPDIESVPVQDRLLLGLLDLDLGTAAGLRLGRQVRALPQG